MTAMSPSRKLGRRGVEAIFTSAEAQRDARFLLGLGGIVSGIVLWTTVTLDFTYPKLFGTSEIGSYLSMALSAIGLVLIIDGAAICAVYRGSRTDYRDDQTIGEIDPSPELSDSQRPTVASLNSNQLSRRRPSIVSSANVKNGLAAFVQGCILIVLYSGLADEYQSNVSMQQWLRSFFPAGKYFLNWEAVLLVSAVLGLIVTQFLPGRLLSE